MQLMFLKLYPNASTFAQSHKKKKDEVQNIFFTWTQVEAIAIYFEV